MPPETQKVSVNAPAIPMPVKLLAVLSSAVFVGLGVLAIITEYDVGHTRQGRVVIQEGEDAIVFGVFRILVGLFPLALWMPGKRSAAWFAGLSIGLGVATLVLSKLF